MTRTPTGAATYPTINTVGALLPPDLLSRLAAGELDHLTPGSYGLPDGFTLRQAAARAWELLLPTYRTLQQRLSAMAETDPATSVTRDRWTSVLFRELGYDLTDIPNISIDGDVFDIRHLDGHVPVHMLGWNVDLDKRAQTNVRGASRTAPHSLVQELLNRTDQHLWAILTNGRRLRLLRDNVVMGRPAYVEFDLEGMFGGEQFADFAVMYAFVHATRLRSEEPVTCILEQWRTTAINEGTRALEHLRDGVVAALRTLGDGFLEHPDNSDLRDLLKQHHGATNDYYRWLLRLVYRLIFLFVAEDRDLLHPTETSADTRAHYRDYFSTQHLRELATRRRAGRHSDLWQSLRLVFAALGAEGQPSLGLPAYGSDLFNPGFIGALEGSSLTNQRLLGAVRLLSQLPDRTTGTIRPVDYRNLGAEELGSVYEALLEYVPAVSSDGAFTLDIKGGNARKTSGSYYTPTELVELVLDETLDPVLDERAAAEDPEAALLGVTVCDPACGSGHFLVAAGRRIAKRLAIVRTGDPEPTPAAMRAAMHDVVARCIYGVDLSDLAAELAKISLWLESLTPGQPLAFLDAHIRVGNALIGATPALLAKNVPDIAFTPLDGDDDPCEVCARNGITERITAAQAKKGMTGCTHAKWSAITKAANKSQREASEASQETLLGIQQIEVANTGIAKAAQAAEALSGTDIASLRAQADAWRRLERDPALLRAKEVADSWTAAFFWRLDRTHARQAPTHDILIALQERGDLAPLSGTRDEVSSLARQHRFFHWHLEFPHIFQVEETSSSESGWSGGFTCMLGNPPWDAIQFSDEEFFAAAGRDDIVDAPNASKRQRLIRALEMEDPDLYAAYGAAVRDVDAVSLFVRASGVFPLTGRGKVNTFQIFAEMFTRHVSGNGRSGIISPTGIATSATTAEYFASLVESGRLAALYDFENEARIFAGVHHAFRFCVLAATGPDTRVEAARFAFLVRHLQQLPAKRYEMAPQEILIINPNTGSCPTFHTRKDAEIVLGMYRRHPVLWSDTGDSPNAWGLTFRQGLFNMASDSDKFHTAASLTQRGATFDGFAYRTGTDRWLPLYEAKMFAHFDHRYSTYEGATPANIKQGTLPKLGEAEHDDPDHEVLANYWVAEPEVRAARHAGWTREWFFGWRNITGATNLRTLYPAVIPATAVGHSVPLAFPDDPLSVVPILTAWSSLAVDYVSRQKLSGSNFVYHVMRQICIPAQSTFEAAPTWSSESLLDWIKPRLLELTYTSRSMAPFARDLGDSGQPFRWIPDRRAAIQAELDAGMFHIYGLNRSETGHVLDSFRVLCETEQRERGEYRTKRLVLDAFDAMSEAAASGKTFVSTLVPAPGSGPRHP